MPPSFLTLVVLASEDEEMELELAHFTAVEETFSLRSVIVTGRPPEGFRNLDWVIFLASLRETFPTKPLKRSFLSAGLEESREVAFGLGKPISIVLGTTAYRTFDEICWQVGSDEASEMDWIIG